MIYDMETACLILLFPQFGILLCQFRDSGLFLQYFRGCIFCRLCNSYIIVSYGFRLQFIDVETFELLGKFLLPVFTELEIAFVINVDITSKSLFVLGSFLVDLSFLFICSTDDFQDIS